ncbi:hypothetical protein Tco_0649954, partial [Tanacetum coccineum]
MIGSLMYLTASRPDIQFSTCLCARSQANPKESHLLAVKRIFRYLKGTPNLGLWYPKGSGFDLKAYSDSDYAGCNLDRKSTSGGCQILGGKLVCWSRKNQSSVAMSSAQAEYVAAAGCCAQVLWIKSQLADYDVLYDKVPIFCDNTSVIAILNNPVLHSRTKYIDIGYHFIRDHGENWISGLLAVRYISDPIMPLNIVSLIETPDSCNTPQIHNAAEYHLGCYFIVHTHKLQIRVTGDSITFSLLKVDKPLSFKRDILSSVIGLDSTKDFISLPPHEAMKKALATLGLSDDKRPTMTSVALAHSSPLRLRYFSPSWKMSVSRHETSSWRDCLNNDLKPMKPYHITDATFKDSKISEVPLTSHMCKIAKLPEKPLDLSSEELAKEIEVTVNATQSLDATKSAEEQDNQPQTADTTK